MVTLLYIKETIGQMSTGSIYLGDLRGVAPYKNQIAKSNVRYDEVLQEDGKIFFITLVAFNLSNSRITFINLNGERQVMSFSYWTGSFFHDLSHPICGRHFKFRGITSYCGFYLLSSDGGGLS